MRPFATLALRFAAGTLSVAMIAPAAEAASIPAYTVTDLGADRTGPYGIPVVTGTGGGASAIFSAPTGADATVTSFDGKDVYAFPRTDNQVASSSFFANLPTLVNPFTSAPISTLPDAAYGNPNNIYYIYSGPIFLNANGVAVATELSGVYGHIALAGSYVDTFQRQANGTFVAQGSAVQSPNNYSTGGVIAQALDLNNRDQLLGMTVPVNQLGLQANSYPIFLLTDLHTGAVTNLQDLMPAGWHLDPGQMELDDQGQIVVYADNTSEWQKSGVYDEHAFLLTPAGLSTNPIPAPEPSTLAILAVGGLGLAARRRWKL